MQFSVPQFTDVEDKIIGSLTVTQFGIFFGAGIIIFLAYTLTKSLLVLIVFAVLIGLPAVGIALAKPYGRPMYKTIPYMIKFLLSTKILIFHKESLGNSGASQSSKVETKKIVVAQAPADPRARLAEVNRLLAKNAGEEEELLKKMK